jgi:hypothetical protein
LTWKLKGTKFNRLLFVLQPKTHRTAEIGAGLLRTPTCEGDAGKRGLGKMTCLEAKEKNRTITLSRQIQDWKNGTIMAMLPTPTAMDSSKDGDMTAAAKMMKGATHRSSGQQIQKTLTDAVQMEYLKKNPKLVEELANKPMLKRTKLPVQAEFVEWMRQTTPKKLSEITNLPLTKVEHWFRKDSKGFSHPPIEDWNIIKYHLENWQQWDYQLTYQESIEWKGMLPTPQAQEGDKITRLENQDSITKRVREMTGQTSQLNPRFVAEMMGFPPNWTELPFQSGEQNQSKDTETQ